MPILYLKNTVKIYFQLANITCKTNYDIIKLN